MLQAVTPDILKKNRLVVSVNENINELKEVVVTTEDVEKFLDLKEEEFKGFDYETDKSSKLENQAIRDRVISNGIDFVNIAKLLAKAFSNKTVEEQLRLKPSEILPLVFDNTFFELFASFCFHVTFDHRFFHIMTIIVCIFFLSHFLSSVLFYFISIYFHVSISLLSQVP